MCTETEFQFFMIQILWKEQCLLLLCYSFP